MTSELTKMMRPFYRNPVLPGFYPDPSICRAGDDYYLVTSSFEYFPGVPVFHSRDLVNWEQVGHCLTRAEQVPLADDRYSRGIWAPTIRHHNGVFYMCTTNMSYGRKNFFVHTTDPAGEWSDPVWVDQEGIDPSFFFDEDGSVYFITSGNYLSRIDLESGAILEGPSSVWDGAGGRNSEGPHIYQKDGWYYLMQAEGGLVGHRETIARSRRVWGPYENCPHNPILGHAELPQEPIQGVGHGDLCVGPDGSWWFVFLGTRPLGMYVPADHLGRETFLAPVDWDADGWPVVNDNAPISLEMELPRFAQPQSADVMLRDDFDREDVALSWNYLRNPVRTNYSLVERPGYLRLTGSELTLSDAGSVTFLGRRQQHLNCRVAASFDFEPEEGDEAGLTALQCFDYHYDVGITRIEGRKLLRVSRVVGSLKVVDTEVELGEGPVVLEIRADAQHYHLGYQQQGVFQSCVSGEVRFLSAMLAQTFTGVYFGLYATGNGTYSKTVADIDWFDYESLHV